ncbi:MAG: DNA polymerase III subunit gamma/tau, partial [Gammaproteobacteria bacterium]|nr:DNA polymerase III subunit gamma/tau [Gammaproteobacteria bacterium]
MSYQALARKWRPQTFSEVIGQEHVVSALANALESGRVHHAYLFTGTRGVGKTTLARILAKALNCETGITPAPCGECTACAGITQGSYVDLIEVDAASRTKVEDTREILENVQYAPTVGRSKIYLIDEVHMLSGHSFNALLKTLEEPPGHVKFLLATTDPQKLPPTILSRCIQFNLRAMDIQQLQDHLGRILEAEDIPFDAEGLQVLARSADGSVRDALSLLDQAIAHGNGEVRTDRVRVMLGMIDEQ